MYKFEIYDGSQDLTQWFKDAKEHGYYNNSSKEMLIDYIAKYEDATLFLLYYNDRIVGNSVVHSLKELSILGKDAYRIGARTCLIRDHIDGNRVYAPANGPVNHHTVQMLLPVCIEHVGRDKPVYISTHEGGVGSQDRVHKVWTYFTNKLGITTDSIEIEYKGTFQTFRRIDVDRMYELLKEARWPEAEQAIPLFS